jgi:hypothetical protein
VLLVGAVACTPLRRDDEPFDDDVREVSVVTPMDVAPVVTPMEAAFDPDCLPPDVDLRSPFAAQHDDLRLELAVLGPRVLQPGERLRVQASVHNDSTHARHPFVLPGDGSEVGWREPSVGWSALVESSPGCWRPLPEARTARCGLFDANWAKDVVALDPGGTHVIEALWADHTLRFDEPGRIRVRLHYVWNEGRTTREPSVSPRSSAMAGVPAFELTSNTVEITVVRRFDLELVPKSRPPGTRPPTDLRDLVEVRLTNVSASAQKLVRPSANDLTFELSGSVTSIPRGTWEPMPSQKKIPIASGASIPLLGAASPNPELEYFVDHPVREPVEIRATFRPDPERPDIRVTSEWVDVDLR